MTGRIAGCVAALVLLAWSAAALAQEAYPTKPVRLLVPYPAGGAVDIVGRTLGDELARRWGPDRRDREPPGAGGTIRHAGGGDLGAGRLYSDTDRRGPVRSARISIPSSRMTRSTI